MIVMIWRGPKPLKPSLLRLWMRYSNFETKMRLETPMVTAQRIWASCSRTIYHEGKMPVLFETEMIDWICVGRSTPKVARPSKARAAVTSFCNLRSAAKTTRT